MCRLMLSGVYRLSPESGVIGVTCSTPVQFWVFVWGSKPWGFSFESSDHMVFEIGEVLFV